MNFKLPSPLSQTESLLILSPCFPCPCVPQIVLLQAHKLSASSCHPPTPPVTIPGRFLLLPGLLRVMGTGHLVAAGEGQGQLWLAQFANLPAGRATTPYLWQFAGCTRKRLFLMPQFPYVSALCKASELLPLPFPHNQIQSHIEEGSRGKELLLDLRNSQIFWRPHTQIK